MGPPAAPSKAGNLQSYLNLEILRAIVAGRVPWRFKTRDLQRFPGNRAGYYRVGNGEYSKNAINTIPRNHSVRPDGTDPGDYVRKHRKPAFFWCGRGEYELILNREHYVADLSPEDGEFDVAEGDEETLIRAKRHGITRSPLPITVNEDRVQHIARWNTNPVAIIARYLAEQPYQAYYRRNKVGSPKCGWGARLAAYFWPTPEGNWSSTCARLSDISTRVQRAIGHIKAHSNDTVAAGKLMDAFDETCA
jgi:hypothetical protein